LSPPRESWGSIDSGVIVRANGSMEVWPCFKFQIAETSASISSQVLYRASEGRTVLSTPKPRRIGCTQRWPARTAMASAHRDSLPVERRANIFRTKTIQDE